MWTYDEDVGVSIIESHWPGRGIFYRKIISRVWLHGSVGGVKFSTRKNAPSSLLNWVEYNVQALAARSGAMDLEQARSS